MLNGIHGHQDIERVVYGKPAGAALRAEAERLGAHRVFVTTTKSVAKSALLADVIKELGDRYAGVYAGITAHSPRPCVIEGAQMARDAKADLLVAFCHSAINITLVASIAEPPPTATSRSAPASRASLAPSITQGRGEWAVMPE